MRALFVELDQEHPFVKENGAGNLDLEALAALWKPAPGNSMAPGFQPPSVHVEDRCEQCLQHEEVSGEVAGSLLSDGDIVTQQ